MTTPIEIIDCYFVCGTPSNSGGFKYATKENYPLPDEIFHQFDLLPDETTERRTSTREFKIKSGYESFTRAIIEYIRVVPSDGINRGAFVAAGVITGGKNLDKKKSEYLWNISQIHLQLALLRGKDHKFSKEFILDNFEFPKTDPQITENIESFMENLIKENRSLKNRLNASKSKTFTGAGFESNIENNQSYNTGDQHGYQYSEENNSPRSRRINRRGHSNTKLHHKVRYFLINYKKPVLYSLSSIVVILLLAKLLPSVASTLKIALSRDKSQQKISQSSQESTLQRERADYLGLDSNQIQSKNTGADLDQKNDSNLEQSSQLPAYLENTIDDELPVQPQPSDIERESEDSKSIIEERKELLGK